MPQEKDRQRRIKAAAQILWEMEGRPDGRSDEHWRRAEELESERVAQTQPIVYVIDRGLVKFLKFSGSILAIFITIGSFLWGFNIKQTGKEIDDMWKAVDADRKASDEILAHIEIIKQGITHDLAEAKRDLAAAVREAKQNNNEIAEFLTKSRTYVTAQGLVVDTVKLEIREQVQRQLKVQNSQNVPSDAKHRSLNTSEYSKNEVLVLARRDLDRALAFFRSHGLVVSNVSIEIDKSPELMNVYYNSENNTIYFGMGMANGPIFGPYDSKLIYHEATQSLMKLHYVKDAASIESSICDVMAVLIDGEAWTIGKVRTDDPVVSQALRSLSAPGTAYDQSVLGKDSQPDRMSQYVQDASAPQVNSGILNKAAYLISEGGGFNGVVIGQGIGREKLAQIYAATIRDLPDGGDVDFPKFKEIVLRATARLFPDTNERDVATQSFKAVGI